MTSDSPTWWIGRTVKRTNPVEFEAFGPAIVLAVDPTPYRPSAWIKYDRENPRYRSVDLNELEDIETGEVGP